MMAESGAGYDSRTPTKGQHHSGRGPGGTGQRLVQTKSIECQVSPGLLNGGNDADGKGIEANDDDHQNN